MGLKIVLDTKDAVRAAEEFAKAVGKVREAVGDAGKFADKFQSDTSKMARRFGSIGKAASAASGKITLFSSALRRVPKDADRAEKSVKRFGSTSRRTGGELQLLIRQFLGFQAIRGTVSTLAQLEGGLVTLSTVSGASAAEIERLNSAADALSRVTRFTPEQATEAMISLARAGNDASDSIAKLPSVAALAQAGVISLSQSAELLNATLAQFQTQSVNAADAASVLVAVADRNKTTVLGLGASLAQAGQAAATFGVSLAETAAVAGALQDAGVQASRAGRAIKTILAQLASAGERSESSREALKALGLEAGDVIPSKFKKFTDVLKEIRGGLDGLSDERKVNVLRNLVGKDFFAVLGAAIDGIEKIDRVATEAASSQGELTEKQKAQNETLSASFNKVQGAFQRAIKQLDRDLGVNQSLKELLADTVDFIEVLAGVEGSSERASEGVQMLAARVKVLATAFVGVKVLQFTKGLGLLVARLGDVVKGLVAARAATVGLKAAIASTGIGLLLIGIGELAARFLTYESAADKAAAAQKRLNDRIKEAEQFRKGFEVKFRRVELGTLPAEELQKEARGALDTLATAAFDSDEFRNAARVLAELRSQYRLISNDTTRENLFPIELQEAIRETLAAVDEIQNKIGRRLLTNVKEEYRDVVRIREAAGQLTKQEQRRAEIKGRLAEQARKEAANLKARDLAAQAENEKFRERYDLIRGIADDEQEFKRNSEKGVRVQKLSAQIAEQQKLVESGRTDAIQKQLDLEDKKKRIEADSVKLSAQKLKIFERQLEAARLLRKAELDRIAIQAKADKAAGRQGALQGVRVAQEQARLAGAGQAADISTSTVLFDEALRNNIESLRDKFDSDQELKDVALQLTNAQRDLIINTKKRSDQERQEAEDLKRRQDAAKLEAGALRGAAGRAAQARRRLSRRSPDDAREEIRARAEGVPESVRERVIELDESTQKLIEIGEQRRQVEGTINSALGSFAQTLLSGDGDIRQALGNLAQSLVGSLIDQAIQNFSESIARGIVDDTAEVARNQALASSAAAAAAALQALATSAAGSSGGNFVSTAASAGFSIFNSGVQPGTGTVLRQTGGIIPAQVGQIISSPTVVQRGGRNYSISEGGGSTPEAVMPLMRDNKGRLGVAGGGGGMTTINMNFPNVQNTQEARALRTNMSQTLTSILGTTPKKSRGARNKK